MILETERLILRPFKETDAAAVYEYAKDDRVGPIAGWPPHISVEQSKEIIQTIFNQEGVFAVTLKNTDKVIGMISLIVGAKSNFPITEAEAEISYWLGVPFWGKGIMPEAIKEIVRYGFENLRLVNIWSGYYDGNAKSKIAQEKCGFRHHHIEEASESVYVAGAQVEHISRMTRDEWTMATYGKVSF
ncbi:GNAT family N-acetyltransferase [Flavobacterium sp. xlx-214]|nr:GNAT family N-acetyltransferase [Flavobacterium sp. xlx-221]QMI83337.1 GNAT family N-acetyltransferase [Flavobacterium sp. xlx-214]